MANQINNSRIAKNTALLYLRTLFVMFVTLFTSRVILQSLGVEDYGVYQVVGGMVAMFGVLSSAMSASISRFITYEIGKGDQSRLKIIFSSSVLIQLMISVIVLIIAEIIGLWFMETQMQIPEGRMTAAKWVLQCTLLTFCINLISVPYNACIIAHEHMKAFAYISVLDAVAKLAISYLIFVSPADRLISYAVLLCLLSLIIRYIYVRYCHNHFEESRCKLTFDKSIFSQIGSFAGWSFFTNASSVFNSQGVNMLINVFFGVTVNAARGLSAQVEHSVISFVNNFTVAINPQITKSYAAGDNDGMYGLVCRGAKFSYLAMLLFSLPLIIETEAILNIWLTTVPPFTVILVRLSLVLGMLDTLGKTCFTACQATGKMKRYALILTPVACLQFPLAWIAFALGGTVVYAYFTYIVVKALVLCTRLYLIKSMLGFNPFIFVKKVYFKIIPATIVAFILPVVIIFFFQPSSYRLVFSILIGIISVALCSLYIAMTRGERRTIVVKANQFVTKIRK